MTSCPVIPAPALLAVAGLLLGGAVAAQTPQVLSSGSGPGLRHPVAALDADLVVWLAMAGGTRELFAGATDGTPPVQLTTNADVHVGHGTLDVWSPISVSDDGRRIAYWNAQGVHVLDRQTMTDVVVAPARLLPMPRLDGDGSRLVYQDVVSGALEVFLVDSAGQGPPVRLTRNSGPGRRLPHVRGDLVLFQKPVGAEMELFVHDLATRTTTALTSGSGGGNRHGRLVPDGTAVVYEAVVAGALTAMRLDLATAGVLTIAPGSSGLRMPQGDADAQVVLQSTATTPAVELYDPSLAVLSTGSRGGHRLPSIDRHGRLVAWQEELQGQLEVFALRRCWPATVSSYGAAGQPSIGALVSFAEPWRCEQRLGVATDLAAATPALFAVGLLSQNVALAGAPGNFQLVVPTGVSFLLADAQGDVTAGVPLSATVLGFTFYAQFAVFDAGANALGVATSAGFDVRIR